LSNKLAYPFSFPLIITRSGLLARGSLSGWGNKTLTAFVAKNATTTNNEYMARPYKLTKYKNLQKLLMERDLRYWQVAAKVFMPERTFRYKMSDKSPGFYSAEMFRIQRNVFPDKTIEEIFGE